MGENRKRLIKVVIIYSAKPYTIFYPFPVLPVLVAIFAGGSLIDVLIVVLFTALFYSTLNLWNHVNDYKEDFEAGKDTPFFLTNVRKVTIAYIFIAYTTSAAIYLLLSSSFVGKVLFLLVLIFTFLYSDNTLTKLRLKRHYITELLTYIVCIPSFILSLYDLVKPIDVKALLLAISLLPLVISTVFIKDLKDISEDKKAGLLTLGVVFKAENLIKIFFYLNIIFYVIFIIFLVEFTEISPIFPASFLIVPTYYFSKNTKQKWNIDSELVKSVKITIYTGFLFTVVCTILFYLE